MKVVESTMKRTPNLRGWGYWNGFFLSAMHKVYRRTNESRYLDYIRAWADSSLDEAGQVRTDITSLDLIQPGLVLMLVYESTGTDKYRRGPADIRAYLEGYPRTDDEGFWHMTRGVGSNTSLGVRQLWLDGTYMSTPFLMKYGELFDDLAVSSDEAARQLTVYASHLRDPATGLLYHAYDSTGTKAWADPVSGHSPEFWGRSMGWYGMALIEVLETLPAAHPQRDAILDILQGLVSGLAEYQSDSGLWYQVVNKGDQPGNWLETSCSCMYTYIVSRAVRRGYIAGSYADVAARGYQGVLTKFSVADDGTTRLVGTCQGTDVGDYDYYIDRRSIDNDMHGLGAFIIMNEEMMQ